MRLTLNDARLHSVRVGQEPTLFYATVFALEALGGRPRYPIAEKQRREYGGVITTVELLRWTSSPVGYKIRIMREGLVSPTESTEGMKTKWKNT